MYLLLFILASCLPKITSIESSNSPCIDSLQFNLLRENCKSIVSNQIDEGTVIQCREGNMSLHWSGNVFFIQDHVSELRPIFGAIPICVDPIFTLYFISIDLFIKDYPVKSDSIY